MKFTSSLFNVLILVTLLILTSCQKDDDITAPSTSDIWSEVGFLQGDEKILLNAKVSNDQLTFAGVNEMLVLEDTFSFKQTYISNFGAPLNERPAIFNDLILFRRDIDAMYLTTSVIGSGRCMLSPSFPAYIKLEELDSSLYSSTSQIVLASASSKVGVFNSRGQFLFVSNGNSNSDNGYTGIDIINFQIGTDPNDINSENCTTVSPIVKRVYHPKDNAHGFVTDFFSIDTDFYIQLVGSPLLHIDSSGRVTETNIISNRGGVRSSFKISKEHYMLTYDHRLYKKSSIPAKWDLVDQDFSVPNTNENINLIFSFNDKIGISTSLSNQIFVRSLADDNYQELYTAPLSDLGVRNINCFKGKVWVTSLNGLFYCEMDDLLHSSPSDPD